MSTSRCWRSCASRASKGRGRRAERILVCVGGDALSETVIRTAARLATAQKADWIALHLKPSDREIADRAVVRRTEKMMRLAERLGASTVRLSASDLAGEILAYAKRNNITQIIIGRSKAGPARPAARPFAVARSRPARATACRS